MGFKGYGNQAAAEQKTGGGGGGKFQNRDSKPHSFGYSEKLSKDKRNYLNTFFLKKDTKDVEVILLDDIKSDQDDQFGVLVHQFWYNGREGIVTSLEGVDEKGCPYAHALRERPEGGGDFRPRLASSVWLLSGIELKEFTYEKGPNAGKTVHSRRVLIPVPRGRTANSKVSRVDEFMNYATKLKGGLRLQRFQVSRSGGKTSAKIGTTWWPTQEPMSAELKAKLTSDAEFYGFASLEDYLKPVNYREVCKPKSFEDAKRLAAFIEQDRRENPGKFGRLDDEPTPDVKGDAYEGPDPKTSSPVEEGESLPF